jgi:hypothetical protein
LPDGQGFHAGDRREPGADGDGDPAGVELEGGDAGLVLAQTGLDVVRGGSALSGVPPPTPSTQVCVT